MHDEWEHPEPDPADAYYDWVLGLTDRLNALDADNRASVIDRLSMSALNELEVALKDNSKHPVSVGKLGEDGPF